MSRFWMRAVCSFVLLLSACGGRDGVSELNEEWQNVDREMTDRLTQISQKHTELSIRAKSLEEGRFTNPDSPRLRNEVEETIEEHDSILSDIEHQLRKEREHREEALQKNERGRFEAARNAAEVEYASIRAKLDALDSQQEKLESSIQQLIEEISKSGQ